MVIPFELPAKAQRGPVVLVLILEKQNLERMKQADPFDFDCRAYQDAGLRVDHRIRDLDIVIAYEEDTNPVLEFHARQDVAGFLGWLERGRQNRAERSVAASAVAGSVSG